jgi:hypothetical protein
MNIDEVKDFLDEKVMQYNNKAFVETDPISIPHRFEKKKISKYQVFLQQPFRGETENPL